MPGRTATRWMLLLLTTMLCLQGPGAEAAFGVYDPIHAFILEVAVDSKPSGNTANAVASVDAQHFASLGSTTQIDVVVDEISDINTLFEPGCDNGEESGCGLTQLEFEVTYDPQIVRVVAVDPNQLLCANGCPNRISQTEGVPDTDGRFFVFEKDDISTPETGEGVLVRLTLQCMAPGETKLAIDHPQTGVPQISDASGGIYPVSVITPATLVCLDAAQVGANQELSADLSGDPFDADDTGLRLFNAGPQAATVEWGWLQGDPLRPGDTVQPGFALIDGTLLAQSDIAAGELRARYRVEYDARAVRRAGIRANQVRLMRRNSETGRWGRAIRAIRARAVQGRYLPRMEADFTLGHHGYTTDKGYVWAVVDVNSRYAIGGPIEGVPIPALGALGLVAAGVALLGATSWELRRRR